jgi:glycosyltransferase involved in cell wall biosynthesis
MNLLPVTIVIPAYNAEAFLAEAVLSAHRARAQKILIVNDGSTDNTLRIANDLCGLLSNVSLVSQANLGESSALNWGLSFCDTEFVLFLSADDLIDENLLTLALEEFAKRPESVVVYPSWNVVTSSGQIVGEVRDIDFSYERLLGQLECLPGPGAVVRRSAIGAGRNPRLRQINDLDQWIRVSKIGEFKHLDIVLASWRKHDTNMSHRSFGKTMSLELDIVRETANDFFKSTTLPDKKHVSRNFLFNWYRRKAFAEAEIPSTLGSAYHAMCSIAIQIGNPRVIMNNRWTTRQILGSLFPWAREGL